MSVSPISSSASQIQASQIQAQQVSAAVLQSAESDGDGRTGTAALNDGDSAAQQAALQIKAGGIVNVTA